VDPAQLSILRLLMTRSPRKGLWTFRCGMGSSLPTFSPDRVLARRNGDSSETKKEEGAVARPFLGITAWLAAVRRAQERTVKNHRGWLCRHRSGDKCHGQNQCCPNEVACFHPVHVISFFSYARLVIEPSGSSIMTSPQIEALQQNCLDFDNISMLGIAPRSRFYALQGSSNYRRNG
jgi:hypothetical protein